MPSHTCFALFQVIPITWQQFFIYLVHIAQLTLSILIRQRVSRLPNAPLLSQLHGISTGFLVFVVLLLACNGAVPKRWKRYQGIVSPIAGLPPWGNRNSSRRQGFRGKGRSVSTKHMVIPVFEVLLACVFGISFGMVIGRLGVPPAYGSCQTTGAEVECRTYRQLFDFVLAVEGLLAVIVVFWTAFLFWQKERIRVFIHVTFYLFPLLYLRKRRTAKTASLSPQSENPPAVPSPEAKEVTEPAAVPPAVPSKLYTLLSSYPTLSSLAANLHECELLNLLLASKHCYHLIRSTSGGNLRTIFAQTCDIMGAHYKRCDACKGAVCYGFQSPSPHCNAYRSFNPRPPHLLCEMICTRCRYHLLLETAAEVDAQGQVNDNVRCECRARVTANCCGTSEGMAEICMGRWARRFMEERDQRHIIHLNGPGEIRRTYPAVLSAKEEKCYWCWEEVTGLRWWVHWWAEDQSQRSCQLDCEDQEAHCEGVPTLARRGRPVWVDDWMS